MVASLPRTRCRVMSESASPVLVSASLDLVRLRVDPPNHLTLFPSNRVAKLITSPVWHQYSCHLEHGVQHEPDQVRR
jgi:hypothetical protein